MANSRPVLCSAYRSTGARSQFQPKTAMNKAARDGDGVANAVLQVEPANGAAGVDPRQVRTIDWHAARAIAAFLHARDAVALHEHLVLFAQKSEVVASCKAVFDLVEEEVVLEQTRRVLRDVDTCQFLRREGLASVDAHQSL